MQSFPVARSHSRSMAEGIYDFVFSDGTRMRLGGFLYPPRSFAEVLIRPVQGCSLANSRTIGDAWRRLELWRPERWTDLVALARAFKIPESAILDALEPRIGASLPDCLVVLFRRVEMVDPEQRLWWAEYHEWQSGCMDRLSLPSTTPR